MAYLCTLFADCTMTTFYLFSKQRIMKKKKNKNVVDSRAIKVIEQDLTSVCEIDVTAARLMDFIRCDMSESLFRLLNKMLMGFSAEMQLEIADDLLDFTRGHVIHTTGCLAVDVVLQSCYMWIAEEQGYNLVIDNK